VMRPDPTTDEFVLVARYDHVTVDEAIAACGWPLRTGAAVEVIAPPSSLELEALRELHARTRAAHAAAVKLPI